MQNLNKDKSWKMRKLLDSLELFFARFIPAPLRKYYSVAVRYFTFVFGGLIGWLILVGTEQFLLKAGIWRGIGYALGIGLAIMFTFFYHRYITFGLKSEAKERFVKFAPLQVIISVVNWILFVAATEYFHLPDVPSSFVITFFLSLVNFAANRIFIFRKSDEGKSL